MPGDAPISALIDCAQRLLSEEIVPHLDGERRYLALMIASAMRMAAREAEQTDRLEHTESGLLKLAASAPPGPHKERTDAAAALVDAIRSGAHDGDPHAHGLLWADAVVRTSVTRPSALARIERRMAGLPCEEPGV